MDRVQLGTLHLDLHPTDLEDCSLVLGETEAGWISITSQFIDSGLFDAFTTSTDLIALLADLLADPGIGFEASCRPSDLKLVVRCSLLSSDGRGGDWRKRSKKGDRGKMLRSLFRYLRSGWYGDGDLVLARGEEDAVKINELYARIPSPTTPTYEDWTPLTLGDEDTQGRIVRGDDIKGVRTTLYKYQLRSVNRMIQMEMEPKQLIDARYTKFRQSGGRGYYYVNLATYDIQLHVGRYDLPRGGILCEQMGVGKTLICLAVILSTLHQVAEVPPHEVDISSVITDHMLHTYPFGLAHEIRHRLPPLSTALALPSLSELCANILAVNDRSSALAFSPHLSALLTQKTCYYRYPPDTSCMRRAKAATINEVPEKVYLSKTTLVVVPPILVEQWMQEIEKHVEPGGLKVLRVEGELPSVDRLLDYDIILMDVHRFGREDTMTRARSDLGPSNLLDIRWKRIILDEGHVAGSTTTNAMRFAQALSTERRWAVTGTPTKHLQQGGEKQSLSTTGLPMDVVSGEVGKSASTGVAIKGWTSRDIDDVARLGVVISGYLGAEPFRSDAPFQEVVTSHLKRREIPFGAVGRLKYLMDSLMVKHRADEIDSEASLPPATVETVILPFEPMQRLSYNFLAALVVANVYACDFEDPDYFLHPRNLKSFQQVVKNLQIACLWFSAPQSDARGCLERLENDIATKPGLTEQARTIMLEAADHLRRAIETPGWAEWMQFGVSTPLHLPTLPAEVRAAWSESMGKDTEWIDVHSMSTIRDKNQNGVTIDDLVDAGDRVLNRKREEAAAEHDKAAATAERKKQQLQKKGLIAAQSDAAQNPHTISPRKRVPTKKDKLEEALAQAARNAQLAIDVEARAHLPRPLEGRVQVKTRSHKMNYLVKTIRASLADEKFIIFGDSAELGHCTEVLDFFDISSVYAGGAIGAKARAEALDKFQHGDFKACLLDVKVAARGLNLVVANRMILLAPLWNLDTQAQAIKRIHRIGQTRPTKVEILVTRDTFEEDIAKRSSTTRTENEEKLYTRALIEHPRFVYVEHESEERFEARLAPFRSTDVESSTASPLTPDTLLVTPASSGVPRLTVRDESPTPQISSLVKRSMEEEGTGDGVSEIEAKSKKKARVAFA